MDGGLCSVGKSSVLVARWVPCLHSTTEGVRASSVDQLDCFPGWGKAAIPNIVLVLSIQEMKMGFTVLCWQTFRPHRSSGSCSPFAVHYDKIWNDMTTSQFFPQDLSLIQCTGWMVLNAGVSPYFFFPCFSTWPHVLLSVSASKPCSQNQNH